MKYPQSRNYRYSQTKEHNFPEGVPEDVKDKALYTPQGMNSGAANDATMKQIMMCGTNQESSSGDKWIGYNIFKNASPVLQELQAGSTLDMVQHMTATHEGIVSVGICDVKEPAACLKQRLPPLPSSPTANNGFHTPKDQNGDQTLPFKLPDINCNHCILHWAYINQNSGQGPPYNTLEAFTNCADVKLSGSKNNNDWSSLSDFWEKNAGKHPLFRGCYKPLLLSNDQEVKCDGQPGDFLNPTPGAGGGGGGGPSSSNPPGQDNVSRIDDDDTEEEDGKGSKKAMVIGGGVVGFIMALGLPLLLLVSGETTLGLILGVMIVFLAIVVGGGSLFLYTRKQETD
jgi:hypothetical protein